MKNFKDSDAPKDLLGMRLLPAASLYCQYLNFQKEQSEYTKTPELSKLKMIKMFLPKVEKLVEETQDKDIKLTLTEQLVFLKHRLFRDMEDYTELFANIRKHLSIFQFSEHIDSLAQITENDKVFAQHADEIEKVFFEILDEQCRDNTIANYNMQKRFIDAVFRRIDHARVQTTVSLLKEKSVRTTNEFIHVFEQLEEQASFLERYLKVMAKYLQKFLVKNKDKFRSKNYLILTLDVLNFLLISSPAEVGDQLKPLVRDLIATVVNYYKNTLTLADELHHLYINNEYFRHIFIEEVERVIQVTTDDSTLCSLVYQKMIVEVSKTDLYRQDTAECIAWINRFFEQFERFEKIFYDSPDKLSVEKGDRLNNDQYLFAVCEILRILRDRAESAADHNSFSLYCYLLLEFSRRSPYNFDLMLRHLEINNGFAMYEENSEYFKKHDLKGNQHDTLSYLFYRDVNAIPVINLAQKFSEHSREFYRECEKESIESFKGCCKHTNFRVLEEFYLYERLNCNSVHRVILDLLQAEHLLCQVDKSSSQLPADLRNIEGLVEFNAQKLTQDKFKLSLNQDLVQIQIPSYFTQSVFNFDLFGIYKDLHVVKAKNLLDHIFIKLLLEKTKDLPESVLESLQQEVAAVSPKNLSSFEDYFVYRRVNNPLRDAKDRKPYREQELQQQMETCLTSLKALQEFATVCLLLSRADEASFDKILALASLPALAALKASFEKSVEAMDSVQDQFINYKAYSSAFGLLHSLRLMVAVFKLAGDEVKASSKKLIKQRPEPEKEQVRAQLAQFTGLKDYLRDQARRLELQFKALEKVPDLKEGAEAAHGIAWPTALREAMPRLLKAYAGGYRNAAVDTHVRMSLLQKSMQGK